MSLKYPPCKNPNCKSLGKSHPNCHCWDNVSPSLMMQKWGLEMPGVTKGMKKRTMGEGEAQKSWYETSEPYVGAYAKGGNVEASEQLEHPCTGVHHTSCEHYAGDPELGKTILKNAIQRHTSEDELTDSLLSKSQPEQAMHGMVANSGATILSHGSLFDSSGASSKLVELTDKQLANKANKFINQVSMIAPDQAMNPTLIKEVIRPAVKKLIGKTNPHIVDAVITSISRGETDQLGAIINHASQVSKGHKSIENALEALFTEGDIDQSPSDEEREHLRDFVKSGGLTNQIINQNQALTNQPVQNFAEGGEVDANAPQSPVEKAFPEQSMLLGMTKANIDNYLNQQQPQPNPMLPFDAEFKDIPKEKAYNRALDVANKPLSVLQHVKDGTLMPEHMQHLNGMYPDLYNHLGKKVTERVLKAQLNNERPSYKVRQGLSLFLGAPLDSTFTPANIQAAQSVYQPQATQPAPNTPVTKNKKNTSSLKDVADAYATGDQARAKRLQDKG